MLTITASAIGCTGKLQGLYKKKLKKWEIRPRPRKIVIPEDFILKLCTRDYVGRLPTMQILVSICIVGLIRQ